MEVEGWLCAPALLPSGKESSTHWIGNYVYPRASRKVCQKWKPN